MTIDDFCFIYMSIARTGYPGPKAAETELAQFVKMLYQFTYYRYCDTEQVAELAGSNEVDLSDDCCDYVDLQVAATHLHRLLQSVRYQTIIRAGEANGQDQDPLIEVISHFIQLAYIQFRVEFGSEGFYQTNAEMNRRLKASDHYSCAIFTNQEVGFISGILESTVSKEIRNEGILKSVANSKVLHWTQYSELPDHLFPRKGNEVGNKQSFINHESLQTWLAGRTGFYPTQFVYRDDFPEYTSPTFFRDTYLSALKKRRIKDIEFCDACKLSERHLRYLKKGIRPLFLRQANIIDNYLYGNDPNPFRGDHQCFPLYHELSA